MDKKLLTKADAFLLAGLIVLGILVPRLFIGKVEDEQNARLQITLNGELLGEYSLNEDRKIFIDKNGVNLQICNTEDYNVVTIKDGKASVTDADCKGLDCVNSKAISKPGEVIACLPHKLLLTIVQKEEQTDVVVY